MRIFRVCCPRPEWFAGFLFLKRKRSTTEGTEDTEKRNPRAQAGVPQGKGGKEMLFATELVGASAYDSQAHFVGRVREFFVEPAEQPNRISHFLISRGRFQPLVARYDQVSKVAPGRIDLNVSERALEAYKPNEGWLAVQKDLMDQQIIDTEGRKVVRVNDVDLSEIRTNEHVELRIAQVDVGLPGAMRRLLQGIAPSSVVRKLQGELQQCWIR